MIDAIRQAVAYIQQRVSAQPAIGLILGSGLGEYAETFPHPAMIPYAEIPHFPQSTIPGHRGRLVFQTFGTLTVVVMQGRFHYYEGYSMAQVTFPIRVFGMLGIRRLFVTNAAGGIHPQFRPGDLMLITDHLNLMGDHPLRGSHHEAYGPRFPDLSEAYHPEDSHAFETVAATLGIALQKGVYAGLSGPSYETPAEIRMLRALGADAVGMSTVPEVIVANQMGIRVVGVSCISNLAAGISADKLNHQEVIETAEVVKPRFMALLDGVIHKMEAQPHG